jgi:shikimate kinase
MRIYLTGYMGSGKSRHGRDAARRLGLQFLDLDTVIEQQAGMKVVEIFARFGEPLFREMEQAALKESLQHEEAIVATGGGTPCFEANQRLMQAHGKLVYLQMHPRSLAHRLKIGAARRPLLAPHQDNLEDFISSHLEERKQWYLQADMVLKGEGLTGKMLADAIATFGIG